MEIVLVVPYWMLPIAHFKDVSILLLYVEFFQKNEKTVDCDVACFEFEVFEHECCVGWQCISALRGRGNGVMIIKAKIIA